MSNAAVPQFVIGHEATLAVLEGASKKASELGIKVNVAVIDSGGNLTGFVRMPGSFLASIDVALRKAKSAASFGIPPEVLEQVLDQNAPRVREGILAHPSVTLIRGGLPIVVDGKLLGGVGVSGGSEDQDVVCAKAGLAAIGA